jgi:hypothetical protein
MGLNVMLDITTFKRNQSLTNPKWVYVLKDPGIEIYIGGDANSPDTRRFEIAQQVIPHIKVFEEEGILLLHSFFRVASMADFEKENWEMLWIDFGEHPCVPIEEFSIFFTPGMEDIYGLYLVTFNSQDIEGITRYWKPRGKYPTIFPFQVARRYR